MTTDPRLAETSDRIADTSLSRMAQGLIGSEVLRIAADVRTAVAGGRPVCNLTVGDFDRSEFPLPPQLVANLHRAVEEGHTNYPPSNGVPELRRAIARFYARELGIEYPVESVLVAGGARPIIFAAYRTFVDPGETVAFPVPSWNNNHYCYLAGAKALPIEVEREHGFHPTPEQIGAILPNVRMLALCTPSNPTGTHMAAARLEAICRLLLDENRRRAEIGDRPAFLLYDQVYWSLAFGDSPPITPTSVCPEVKPYVVLVDAISKSLAATGLRVGWGVADPAVTQRMSDFLGHVGAWAPKAAQVALAPLLEDPAFFTTWRSEMRERLRVRLDALHRGFESLRASGAPVEAVAPEGTLYLSIRIDLLGRIARGRELATNEDIRRLLLEEAGIAVVPFQAFGLERESGWFRLSVGAVSVASIEAAMERLEILLLG